jgi:hypothetical protein
MNKKNTEYLYATYPNLYQNHSKSMRETCMCWGFECSDGWFKIIDELSAKLEPLGIVAEQVKEKFGTLRFYIGGVPTEIADEVWAAIEEAEQKSEVTCEVCGAPGELRGGGWVSTLCDPCNAKGGRRSDEANKA